MAPGRPLAEVTNPFDLEVHPPVRAEDTTQRVDELPTYVQRGHDALLAEIVRAAIDGRSGMAVLVGGSSTGKTRACWEILEELRIQRPDIPNGWWRLWHPLAPSHVEAALRGLPLVAPRTVIWLNEAELYLDPSDGRGAELAAGLRELLRDQSRGPVLILATLWSEHWHKLTTRSPQGAVDPHAQARGLLTGRDITVPDAFTEPQLRGLAEASDSRLRQAVRLASNGQITQFLAGAPQLLSRYEKAPAPARALIHAAMDARRLGMSAAIPRSFLEAAASAYLTDFEWGTCGDNWLEEGLKYTGEPCMGARGPLSLIRPRPGDADPGEAYRLADYLEQHGRRERRAVIPPLGFWAACETLADPGELRELGNGAGARGLLFQAARLVKQAVIHGDARAARDLVYCMREVFPDVDNPQWRIAEYIGLDDAWAVALLMSVFRAVGAEDALADLVAREPGTHVVPDDVPGAMALVEELWRAGAGEQAAALAVTFANDVALDDAFVVAQLIDRFADIGAKRPLEVLMERDPVAHASLRNHRAGRALSEALSRVGAHKQATALALRFAEYLGPGIGRVPDQSLRAMPRTDGLMSDREPAVGSTVTGPARTWPRWVPDEPRVGSDWRAMPWNGDTVAHPQLVEWLFEDTRGVARLLQSLVLSGDREHIDALLARDPAAHASLSDPLAVAELLRALADAGAAGQQAAMADRVIAESALGSAPLAVLVLIALKDISADGLAADLVDRLPAGGQFRTFLEQDDNAMRYRFGREPDGTPTAPWGWEDLDT
jgi:hypothetical protein